MGIALKGKDVMTSEGLVQAFAFLLKRATGSGTLSLVVLYIRY